MRRKHFCRNLQDHSDQNGPEITLKAYLRVGKIAGSHSSSDFQTRCPGTRKNHAPHTAKWNHALFKSGRSQVSGLFVQVFWLNLKIRHRKIPENNLIWQMGSTSIMNYSPDCYTRLSGASKCITTEKENLRSWSRLDLSDPADSYPISFPK